MGDCVDQETAKSQGGPDIGTEASQQTHYINWAEIFRIQDPCGYYPGYQRIVAIYTKYVQSGVNYNNKQVVCFAMVQGCAKAVNTLFKLCGFAPPANLSDPSNMTAILINNMLRKEDIAWQCAPLNNKIFAELRRSAMVSKNNDSINNLLFNFVALGHYTGPRLSEYARTTQDKVDYHTYHSGTKVLKAFIANNFIFYDDRKHIVKNLNAGSLQQAHLVKITWHIQKNCQNSQSITLLAEVDQPKICPVRSAMRLALRAKWLNQPEDMPFGVYRRKRVNQFTLLVIRLRNCRRSWTSSLLCHRTLSPCQIL
jgi:hypothetical protein